jgi:hypothetical protein
MISEVDPLGRQIVMPKAIWETHVISQRPWMAAYLSSVEQAIRSPTWIIDYEERECFYAERALPHLPHLLLKLVVEFADELHGVVITAYPLKRQKPSEGRRWPKP